MNHKSFVFFDCECANTFDGVGKICSIGYVICDDELNVLESEDVVINPECEFDWYLFSGKGGCKLAYSKDYFRVKPNYESYYKDIKKLFTTGNRYIAGFAVGNDISFVNSASERYNLDYISLRAFDVEKFLEKKYSEKHKLVDWAQKLGVNVAKFQSHKSVDDAMMTMLCLKAYCLKNQATVEQVLTENKDLFISGEQMLIQAEERAYKKEIMDKIRRLYNKKCPKPAFKTVLDEYFELDGRILKNDIDEAFELVKQIYNNGGVVCEHLTGRGSAVFEEMPSAEIQKKIEKRGLKVITLKILKNLLYSRA